MKFVKHLLIFIFGTFYAMGFPILGSTTSFVTAPIIAFAGFFFYLNKSETISQSMRICLSFSLGFYALGFYWIPHTLTEFGNLGFPYNQILGLGTIFAVCPHLFVFSFIHFFIRTKLPANSVNNILKTLIFLCLQYAIPQIFNAYPGHAWIKMSPYIYPASIFGEYIFSFISILAAFEILHSFKFKKHNQFNWLIIFLFFISCFIPFGKNYNKEDSFNLYVRIAQANIGNNSKLSAEKGLPNSVDKVLNRYVKLSTEQPNQSIDLIVWPETAYPFSLPNQILNHGIDKSPKTIQRIISKTDANVLFGGYLDDTNHYGGVFNSAFFITRNDKNSVYNKNKLLPFGESLPFTKNINRVVLEMVPGISLFSRAKSSKLFNSETKRGEQYSFFSFICYEALSSELIRNHIRSFEKLPQFMANLTNDSWYGNSSEPEQHLFLARWRSVEFGIPMVRSSNTGISTYIDRFGRVGKRTEYDQVAKLDQKITLINNQKGTIYLHWGIFPVIIFIIFILISNLILSRKTFSQ